MVRIDRPEGVFAAPVHGRPQTLCTYHDHRMDMKLTLRIVPIFVLLAHSQPAVGQQPANAANSPAAARAESFLEALRGSAPIPSIVNEQFTPSFRDAVPIEQHVGVLDGTRARLDRWKTHTVTSESLQATVLLHDTITDQWFRFQLGVDSLPPHRISQLVQPAPAPAPAGTPAVQRRATDAEAVRELDRYVQRLVEADLFSGAVLVAREGESLFQKAYGEASREYGAPNRPDTRYPLGSINKMFTTVAILQLVEQGKLSLEDRVETVMPGVLPDSVARKIQIQHLLTHTSGLGDFLFTPEASRLSRNRFRTVSDWLPLLKDARLQFEPGTRWGYSNAGFLVLGAILEKVTGQDYHTYVREHVFRPAGMTASDPLDMDLAHPNVATAYTKVSTPEGVRWRSDRYERLVRGTPAGGGYSTVEDLLRFAEALRSNRLLSPAMTQRMLSAKPELNSPQYGFGTQIFVPDGAAVGHTGGGPGTAAWLHLVPKTGVVMVVLGNMAGETPAIVRRAQSLLPER